MATSPPPSAFSNTVTYNIDNVSCNIRDAIFLIKVELSYCGGFFSQARDLTLPIDLDQTKVKRNTEKTYNFVGKPLLEKRKKPWEKVSALYTIGLQICIVGDMFYKLYDIK